MKKRIGLALSGGGFRAAAFHLGTLKKLNELGLLNKIDVISTISGGSIIGAYYVLHSQDFDSFASSFQNNLKRSVITRIVFSLQFLLPIFAFLLVAFFLLFDPLEIHIATWFVALVFAGLLFTLAFFQFRIISFSRLKIRAYKKIFFGDSTICDLPDNPILAINCTNLSTGTLWTFSKKKTSDSSYEYPKDNGGKILFDCSKMPVAIAVAASTSVPIPFDPVYIPKKFFSNAKDFKRVRPALIDGGLYDNQGIHKITQKNSTYRCDIIIVSDGSQPFPSRYKASNSVFILYRGIDVMMRKIKNLQFIRDVLSLDREIAYFSLDWRYKRSIVEFVNSIRNGYVSPNVLDSHKIDDEILKKQNAELVEHISSQINFDHIIKFGITDSEIDLISGISTNLTALRDDQIDLLSRHGQVLTELQIKLYCPSLSKTQIL